MRLQCLVVVALIGWLTGCAKPAPPAPQQVAGSAPQPDKPSMCGGKLLNSRIRPGEDALFVFTVMTNSQWCFDGVTRSGDSTEGQRIIDPPSHGQVRLVRQPGAIVFGYRPAPGFVGTDRFRIAVPTEIETTYLAATATVTP